MRRLALTTFVLLTVALALPVAALAHEQPDT